MDGRVRAAHDPGERRGGDVPVALVGERLATLQQPDRDVCVERTGSTGITVRGGGRVTAPARGSGV